MSTDAKPLLSTENNEEEEIVKHTPRSLYINFLIMSIAFSVNHGCVVSCLTYASAELGDELGSYGSGCLYICYALTAFLIAKPVVATIGPKNGLMCGVVGYCVYVAGFLFALLVPELSWPVFLIAASIGGVAGGLLWPSQGGYFTANSKLYSKVTGIEMEKTNATFAGIFATSYLCLEMLTKVLATVVFITYPKSAKPAIFTIYTALSVISCVFIYSISSLDFVTNSENRISYQLIMNNVGAAASISVTDIRVTLILPFQLAFGFASSFVPYYIFGTVIADSDQLGDTWVGLLSAIIVLVGGATAIPVSVLTNIIGKAPVMAIGGLCLAFSGFIIFFISDQDLGTWKAIVPYLIVYGIGRGTWVRNSILYILLLFDLDIIMILLYICFACIDF